MVAGTILARHGGAEQLGMSVGVEGNQFKGLRWAGDLLWDCVKLTQYAIYIYSVAFNI